MNGKEIAEEMESAHKVFYGTTRDKSGLFIGGNIGIAMLGASIERAAKTIGAALKHLEMEQDEDLIKASARRINADAEAIEIDNRSKLHWERVEQRQEVKPDGD